MRKRTTRAAAIGGALTLVSSMGIALLAPTAAIAGTGGGGLACDETTLAPTAPALPIGVSVTASPASSVFPSGATINVNNATVDVTLIGPVVGAFAQSTGATKMGLPQAIINLAASNTTGSLQATVSAPAQSVTGYSATGGPGGSATADPITFHITGVDFGHVVSQGADGGHSDITPANGATTGDGFIISFTNGLLPSLGFGTLNNATGGPGAGDCAADSTFFGPNTAIATVQFTDPRPVVSATGSYGAVAGIVNDLQVTASDTDATPVDASSWSIASGPTCGSDPNNGSATVTGTTTTGVVHFTAPSTATTCQIGVTVKDTNGGTSNTRILDVNVTAGDSLQQTVTQTSNAGALSLEACGVAHPVDCTIQMSDLTLNGLPQTSTGSIQTVAVDDARGAPVAWSLTAQLAGDLTNTNSTLSGPHAKIPSDLLLLSPSCSNDSSNSNAAPTAGVAGQTLDAAASLPAAVCAATAGQNTGTFFADGSLSMQVPATVYAGTYVGTINFVVS